MSTSKHKKERRQKQLKAQAVQLKYQRSLSSSKKSTQEFKDYVPAVAYRPEQPEYASFTPTTVNPDATGRRESRFYTGDYITGIAVAHKSNLVPVSRGIDPAEYAQMRR